MCFDLPEKVVATTWLYIETALDVGQVGNQFLGTFVAVEAGKRRVGREITAFPGRLKNALGCVFEDVTVAKLRLFQGFDGGPSLRDVLDKPLDCRIALFITNGNAAFGDPFDLPAFADDPVLHGKAKALGKCRLNAFTDVRAVFGMSYGFPGNTRLAKNFLRAVAA